MQPGSGKMVPKTPILSLALMATGYREKPSASTTNDRISGSLTHMTHLLGPLLRIQFLELLVKRIFVHDEHNIDPMAVPPLLVIG